MQVCSTSLNKNSPNKQEKVYALFIGHTWQTALLTCLLCFLQHTLVEWQYESIESLSSTIFLKPQCG